MLRKFDRELVAELKRLLAKAEAGEMLGIMYTVELEPGQHAFGMSRSYAEQPYSILKITARATHRINEYLSLKAQDPDTGMMSL